MTRDEIQLGEVRRLAPRLRPRPDQGEPCTVVCCGHRSEHELSIFISWTALQSLRNHLGSDSEVELAGVLVGDQCHDDQARPFVVVTHSLAAQDYENSSGSFTFTHSTWDLIARQVDQLSSGGRIIGWYHSHPGWGVFLSDRDHFICEHFFSGAFDIAIVVDSQRNQLGLFHRSSLSSGGMRPATACTVFAPSEEGRELPAEGFPDPLRFFAGSSGEAVGGEQ